MANKPKTLAELTKVPITVKEVRALEKTLGISRRGGGSLARTIWSDWGGFFEGDRGALKNLKDYTKSLEEQKKVLEALIKAHIKYAKNEKERESGLKLLVKHYNEVTNSLNTQTEAQEKLRQAQIKQEQQTKRTQRAFTYGYKQIEDAVNKVVKQSQDLFKISHDLQIQGNMTWNQYTKLYNDSFKAIREMNTALGQSVFNTRQLFEAQQKLVPQGWKGIDTKNLTDLSQAVLQINATLGVFPQELSTAFQMSFRQFESQTNTFVYAIGNRLNAFSNSFGVTVGALTGAVTQMMAANTFLARNNMSAQILASESLMKAVALSSAVGIETSNFMVGLAKTTQFGTASEMSSLYQTGALLQGFSVADFQGQMKAGDYIGATQDLIQSIQGTLGGMGEGYLRNEYMQRIAQGFGLSQDDILQIMTNDYDLSTKALEIQEKLIGINTSMEDELKGLKVDVLDRLTNWWDATSISQGFGKVLQDLGMTNINRQLTLIWTAIVGQDLQRTVTKKLFGNTDIGSGSLQKALTNLGVSDAEAKTLQSVVGQTSGGGAGSAATQQGISPLILSTANQAKPSQLSGLGKLGRGLGGAAIIGGTNYLGKQFQVSNLTPGATASSHVAGGMLNILGGMGGGALAGSAFGLPGAIIGAVAGTLVGVANTLKGVEERKSLLADIEDKERVARKQTTTSLYTDPVMNELGLINTNLRNLLATVDGGFAANVGVKEIEIMVGKADTSSNNRG